MEPKATIKPPALAAGDLLGVIAPASGIHLDKLAEGVRELESLGFKTRFRDDIGATDRYLAGSAERRLEEFREMLEDPTVRGIFCARGGYGSGHLLESLRREELREHPKVFCGSSDITMMLAAYAQAGVVAFHGPMVATTIRCGADGYDRDLVRRILMNGEAAAYDLTGCDVLRPGNAEGRLLGGCLSLLVSTLGTPWEIDTRDTILLVEDVDTRPFQLDRMWTHLRQAGKLDDVRAFVFGEMPGCEQHPEQGYTIQDLIRSLVADLDGPVLFGFPTGHTTRPSALVPIGVAAELRLKESADFRLLEPAVSR